MATTANDNVDVTSTSTLETVKSPIKTGLRWRTRLVSLPYTLRQHGCGLFNKVLSALPFEVHVPGYRYLGPGTKLRKRLARGDQPVNPLDAAALEHDLAYERFSDLPQRHEADRLLGKKAWKRVVSRDAGLGERATALLTTVTMAAKRKLGLGIRRKRRVKRKTKRPTSAAKSGSGIRRKRTSRRRPRRQTGGNGKVGTALLLKRALQAVKQLVTREKKKSNRTQEFLVDAALKAAEKKLGSVNWTNFLTLPHSLSVPKRGGTVSLIPLAATVAATVPTLSSDPKQVSQFVQQLEDAKNVVSASGQKVDVGSQFSLVPNRKNGFALAYVPIQVPTGSLSPADPSMTKNSLV